MKTQVLTAIGENELQPAARLNAALAANDRVKYIFSLLQMACAHAEHPSAPAAKLKRERIACGIDDPDLDEVVTDAHMVGKSCHITGAAHVIERIAVDMRLMAAPVLASKPNGFAGRLDTLLTALPTASDDLIYPDTISTITQAALGDTDSLHRLVMDLHKQLNVMQAALAQETLDGAAAYNLAESDRPLVKAFMAGLNRTAKLKFLHPGLATTATRASGQLIIQNDIGTTDAHVIVIHVKDLVVNVTYADVHPERLAFFQDMLRPHGVSWEKDRTAVLSAGAPFYLATGEMKARDSDGCQAYLEFLGSRLVFLIDWNRARKQLRGFLRAPDRLALLRFAAEEEIGHRGFLEMGGARLVYQAIEATAGSSMHFGDRLCDILGDGETLDCLRFVFRAATEGLLANQSRTLIHDRIRAALATHFSNEERQLLSVAADHAALIFEIANLLRDGLQEDAKDADRHAKRAGRFEHDADLLVTQVRQAVRRRPEYAIFGPLLEEADDAADALEDAVFLIDLDTLRGKPRDTLQALSDLLLQESQEWIKALGHATQIGRASSPAEAEDFLAAIDCIVGLEHQADDTQRLLTACAIHHAQDFRQLHLFGTIGGKLGVAADALKHASSILREHVLGDVIGG